MQAVPELARQAKELYVFQRTPSSVDARNNIETESAWAASLEPGKFNVYLLGDLDAGAFRQGELATLAATVASGQTPPKDPEPAGGSTAEAPLEKVLKEAINDPTGRQTVYIEADGRLAREIRVTDLRLNPAIPSEIMDLEALKASVTAIDMNTPQGQKQEAVDEVQQAVQDFQKKFE